MTDVVEVLQREIDKRKAEIEALEASLKVLTGGKAKAKVKQLALPAPAKAEKAELKAKSEGNFEVNGVELDLTEKELAVANALNEAEDCCSVDYLTDLCGNRQNMHNRVFTLNKKLKAAGAEILYFKGDGYRLQNIEGEAK